MAKGQKRSNREIKKPKKEKAPVRTEDPFSKQMKNAAGGKATPGKGRRP